MSKRSRVFTVFDVLDEKGHFDGNVANVQAVDSQGNSLYRGPVLYPKMMFHPEGETRITISAKTEVLPGNRTREVGEQREIISKIVNDPGEEAAARAAGWHSHPSRAIEAGGGVAASVPDSERVRELEAELAVLRNGAKSVPDVPARVSEPEPAVAPVPPASSARRLALGIPPAQVGA